MVRKGRIFGERRSVRSDFREQCVLAQSDRAHPGRLGTAVGKAGELGWVDLSDVMYLRDVHVSCTPYGIYLLGLNMVLVASLALRAMADREERCSGRSLSSVL